MKTCKKYIDKLIDERYIRYINYKKVPMQITSKFTIGVHVLCALEYFKDEKVTSSFLAGSVGVNPVVVRMVMSDLKDAGLIDISQGKTGIKLTRPLDTITMYDVYRAVEDVEESIFNFHDNPNPACPVGKNIHAALDDKLFDIKVAMENEMKKTHIASVYQTIRSNAMLEGDKNE